MTILRTRQHEHRAVESGITASFIRSTLFVICAYVLEENSCLFFPSKYCVMEEKIEAEVCTSCQVCN